MAEETNSRAVTRRLVTAGTIAAALAPAVARAAIVRTDFSRLPSYGNGTIPPGIRSRVVENVNGLNVHTLEAGYETPGRPLVLLLHGFPELAFSWRKVMLPLANAGFHVVAPDQRGYGRTTGWDDSYVSILLCRPHRARRDCVIQTRVRNGS